MNNSLTIVGWVSIDILKIRGCTHKSLGGAALYSSLAAAKYIDVSLISLVGDDFPIHFFGNSSINAEGVRIINGKSTSFIVSYDKDWMITYEGVSEGVGVELTPIEVGFKNNTSNIYISPMSPNIQYEWIKHCKSAGMHIFLGTNILHTSNSTKRNQIIKMIPYVDIFVCNKEESVHLFKTTDVLKAAQILGKIVPVGIITADKEGCVVIHNNEISQIKAVETDIEDPSGAGDVFAGSFLGNWIKSQNIGNAINHAMNDASSKISSVGIESFLSKTN